MCCTNIISPEWSLRASNTGTHQKAKRLHGYGLITNCQYHFLHKIKHAQHHVWKLVQLLGWLHSDSTLESSPKVRNVETATYIISRHAAGQRLACSQSHSPFQCTPWTFLLQVQHSLSCTAFTPQRAKCLCPQCECTVLTCHRLGS